MTVSPAAVIIVKSQKEEDKMIEELKNELKIAEEKMKELRGYL